MEDKAKQQLLTLQAGKNVRWNTDMPKNSNQVNALNPPKNHNGYVVIQDGKIIGPRYRYYETASENASCGGVTSFDMACKRELDIMVSELN